MSEAQLTLDSIHKAEAILELELDGTILGANKNYVSMVDCGLDEVLGHHHDSFTDPNAGQSSFKDVFWSGLRAGEKQVLEYKRLGRNGQEIWVRASYIPLFDAVGTPAKILSFATDVTGYIKERAALTRTLSIVE